jgi:hypothetical protein
MCFNLLQHCTAAELSPDKPPLAHFYYMELNTSARHAGSRFNIKVPCECGHSYCNGWALRRTRLRHLATADARLTEDADAEQLGKSIALFTH